MVHERVESRNLLIDSRISQIECGDEVIVVRMVSEIIVEKLRHIELCFDGQRLLACGGRFVEHRLRRQFEINQLVALLEVGQLGFHGVQLVANDL